MTDVASECYNAIADTITPLIKTSQANNAMSILGFLGIGGIAVYMYGTKMYKRHSTMMVSVIVLVILLLVATILSINISKKLNDKNTINEMCHKMGDATELAI